MFPNGFVDFLGNPYSESSLDIILLNKSWFSITSVAPHFVENSDSSDFLVESNQSLWIAFALTVTNSINTVSFDVIFEDIDSGGILSVYWNTNQIGIVDGRVALPNARRFNYSIDPVPTNGTYNLGFRLESIADNVSSVIVSNVVLSYWGLKDPVRLSLNGTENNGARRLILKDPKDYNYSVL